MDDGTTTLLSSLYDMAGAVDPAVRYSRWFTNDRGNNPGQASDTFLIEVSNDDGQAWTTLEEVGAGTLLEWVDVELALPIPATNQLRLRFTARDLNGGSLVEAGVDEFRLVDRDQACNICSPSVNTVGTISVNRAGDDVVLDWTQDPAVGNQFKVYQITELSLGRGRRPARRDDRRTDVRPPGRRLVQRELLLPSIGRRHLRKRVRPGVNRVRTGSDYESSHSSSFLM